MEQHRQRAGHQQEALDGAGHMPHMGEGAGQHDKGLGNIQVTSLSLSVSGNIQNVESVTVDIFTPSLHKEESPTKTCSVQDKSNQEACSIHDSNQDKSRNQVHQEEHSAIQAVQVESLSCVKGTADHLEMQESVDQDDVHIQELLLSENLVFSQVASPVIPEASITREFSAQDENVMPGITASSHSEIASLREEFSVKLPAEPAKLAAGYKQVSPVTCEHEVVASNNFPEIRSSSPEEMTYEAPSSKDFSDEVPSWEDITDMVPSSVDTSDEAPSSEDISLTDQASSSEDKTDNTPCSEDLILKAKIATTGQTSGLILPIVQSDDELSPTSTQSLDYLADQFEKADVNLLHAKSQTHEVNECLLQAETQIPVVDVNKTAVLSPSSLTSAKASPDPEQVSSHSPSLSSLGITAVRPGKLFLPTTKLSQLYPPW